MTLTQRSGRARPMGRRRLAPAVERLEGRALLAVVSSWVEQGPAPIDFGQDEGIVGNGTAASPDNPVSGAVEALAVQPGSSDVVYAATANGGVWKTTNATATYPTWTPLTDNLPSTSMGAIAFDPSDATSQTLYAATGLYSSFGDGTGGRGVYRTTDGGATWSVINPGGVFTGVDIKSIVPTTLAGPVLLVGSNDSGSTSGGVYRSADGGATWARLSGDGSSGLPNAAGVTSLVADPSVPNRFYAGVLNNGVYRSDDGGLTWSLKVAGMTSPGNANTRVELAASPAAPGVVFAALLRDGQPYAFYRTADSGDTWAAMDLPTTNDGGTTNGLNPGANEDDEGEPDVDPPGSTPVDDPGGQGSIHFALLADRTNASVVFASGDRQPDPFPNAIGARNYSGRVFRGDASQPAGSQWAPVTNDGANPNNVAGGTSPHADSRDMVFDANGNILQGNDGGIFRLVDPSGTAATRGWTSVIGNLRNTEFHSLAYSSLTHTALGGAQDTGTSFQFRADPAVPWAELYQGDGGNVGVDDTSTPGRSLRYVSFQNFGSFARYTYDASNDFVAYNPVSLIVNGTGLNLHQFDPTIQFYQPFAINQADPTRMLIGTDYLYESTNRGDNLNFLGFIGHTYGLAYGASYRGAANPGVFYVGTYDFNSGTPHFFYRASAGASMTDLEAAGGSYRAAGGFVPRAIALNPLNSRQVYTLDFNGRVYASINAGASWSDVTSNLAAQLPFGGSIGDLRTMAFIGNTTDYTQSALAVAGYGGVYALRSPLTAGVPLSWTKLGSGLPNAITYDLRYNVADNVLSAGVLGRGAWLLNNPMASLPPIGGSGGLGLLAAGLNAGPGPAIDPPVSTPAAPLGFPLPFAPAPPPPPAPRATLARSLSSPSAPSGGSNRYVNDAGTLPGPGDGRGPGSFFP